MRVRRIVGSLVTAALVATPLSLAATSSPAAAATPTTVGSYSSSGWLSTSGYKSQPGATVYGDTVYYSVSIKSSTGDYVDSGTTYVQRRLAGSSAWSTIASASGSYVSGDTRAVKGATYRVIYSGSSEFAPTSAAKTLPVQRKITVANRGHHRVLLVGKVGPKYRGKVAIFKKHGRHWKRWKVVKTNRKSTFKSYLPAPRKGRYYWQVRIPGSRGFAKSNSGTFWTYRR